MNAFSKLKDSGQRDLATQYNQVPLLDDLYKLKASNLSSWSRSVAVITFPLHFVRKRPWVRSPARPMTFFLLLEWLGSGEYWERKDGGTMGCGDLAWRPVSLQAEEAEVPHLCGREGGGEVQVDLMRMGAGDWQRKVWVGIGYA